VAALLASVPDALPPAGASWGVPLLALAGGTVLDRGADVIRPGDVVGLWGADFKGKRGIVQYHTSFGSPNEPSIAVCVEHEERKNKLKVVLLPDAAASKRKTTAPEEVSLRLDDLKSGVVKVYRVASRSWVA
jgi:hypothetical protein